MMTDRGGPVLLCLFVLGLIFCEPQHQTRVIYGAVNQTVTFPVAALVSFKEILWKKGMDKVIEWEAHFQPNPRSFPPYIGRTFLSTKFGDLSIFNLTHSDEDEYELESPDIKDNIKFHLKVIDPALQVDLVVPNTTVPEKASFELDCSIVSCSSWYSRFAVAWFSLRTKVGGRKGRPGLEELEEDVDPTERMVVLRVGHDDIFGPEGNAWEGRLRFQRLSPLLYRLTVLQASPQDTGSYSCGVEEWLPGPQGTWYQLMEQESAPFGIRVPDTGSSPQSIIFNDTLFLILIFIVIFIVILLVRCLFLNLITRQNHLDRHHHQELELQQELQQEEQGAPVMDQSVTPQLLPHVAGDPMFSIHPGAIDYGPWSPLASEVLRLFCCLWSMVGQRMVPGLPWWGHQT